MDEARQALKRRDYQRVLTSSIDDLIVKLEYIEKEISKIVTIETFVEKKEFCHIVVEVDRIMKQFPSGEGYTEKELPESVLSTEKLLNLRRKTDFKVWELQSKMQLLRDYISKPSTQLETLVTVALTIREVLKNFPDLPVRIKTRPSSSLYPVQKPKQDIPNFRSSPSLNISPSPPPRPSKRDRSSEKSPTKSRSRSESSTELRSRPEHRTRSGTSLPKIEEEYLNVSSTSLKSKIEDHKSINNGINEAEENSVEPEEKIKLRKKKIDPQKQQELQEAINEKRATLSDKKSALFQKMMAENGLSPTKLSNEFSDYHSPQSPHQQGLHLKVSGLSRSGSYLEASSRFATPRRPPPQRKPKGSTIRPKQIPMPLSTESNLINFLPMERLNSIEECKGFNLEICPYQIPSSITIEHFTILDSEHDLNQYTNNFAPTDHLNYVGMIKESPVVVSIMRNDLDQNVRAIVWTVDGEQYIKFPSTQVRYFITPSMKDKLNALKKNVKELNSVSFVRVKPPTLVRELSSYEKKQKFFQYKFGVLYCKDGQTSENEMFSNGLFNIKKTKTDLPFFRQTNRQTDKQTNRQTDKQTNRQTDKIIIL